MKKTFRMNLDGEGINDDLVHYYQEWHISGKLHEFLTNNIGKNVEITIKVTDDKKVI